MFTLSFHTDNAGLLDDNELPDPHALADIVQDVATAVRAGEDHGIVRDVNGNTIGDWDHRD